jgi:MFS family permease
VRDSPAIRAGLVLLSIVSTAGVPYTVLMPAVVAEVLGGGPDVLGWLMGASGGGALAGALYLASRQTVVGLGRVILLGSLTFGTSLVAFSFAPSIWIAVPVLAFAGAGFIVQAASTNTVIQTIVDEQFRGRVMAFYTMAFFGSVPVGSLISGVIATYVGAPMTIRIGGLVTIGAGFWFAARLPMLRAAVRPIYIQRGIIAPPDVDAGGTAG